MTQAVNHSILDSSLYSPRLQRATEKISADYKTVLTTPDSSSSEIDLIIDSYQGNNRSALRMMRFLKTGLSSELVAAYVHGSIATGEEVSYSDFDALVILKNEVLLSPVRLLRVVRDLHKATNIMYDFDPLQHHGWFVLTEFDLNDYPEHYLPLEALRHARGLLQDQLVGIASREPRQNQTSQLFGQLTDGIISKLRKGQFPRNMYQLKSLLSQFMLLPATYVQKRDGTGVFKKFSFDLAKQDFHVQSWEIMDEVSCLRESWFCDFCPWQRWMFSKAHPFSRALAKRFSPNIPQGLHKILTDRFYRRMEQLVSVMRQKLQ